MAMLTKSQLALMPKAVRDAVAEQEHADDRKRSRPAPPVASMTGTEQRYALLLRGRKAIGEIASYSFEPVKFTLANRCTYLPDFEIVMPDGAIEYHEVKGEQVWDDAIVKFRVAGQMFQMHRWMWAQWKYGEWQIKAYVPVDIVRVDLRTAAKETA